MKAQRKIVNSKNGNLHDPLPQEFGPTWCTCGARATIVHTQPISNVDVFEDEDLGVVHRHAKTVLTWECSAGHKWETDGELHCLGCIEVNL